MAEILVGFLVDLGLEPLERCQDGHVPKKRLQSATLR